MAYQRILQSHATQYDHVLKATGRHQEELATISALNIELVKKYFTVGFNEGLRFAKENLLKNQKDKLLKTIYINGSDSDVANTLGSTQKTSSDDSWKVIGKGRRVISYPKSNSVTKSFLTMNDWCPSIKWRTVVLEVPETSQPPVATVGCGTGQGWPPPVPNGAQLCNTDVRSFQILVDQDLKDLTIYNKKRGRTASRKSIAESLKITQISRDTLIDSESANDLRLRSALQAILQKAGKPLERQLFTDAEDESVEVDSRHF